MVAWVTPVAQVSPLTQVFPERGGISVSCEMDVSRTWWHECSLWYPKIRWHGCPLGMVALVSSGHGGIGVPGGTDDPRA